MKLSDFLIIYLACGAPFGVYFFLQHRNRKNFGGVYLQSFGLVFVWIPYAFPFLHDFITNYFRQSSPQKSVVRKLEDLQKKISQMMFDSGSRFPIFEFREIFERYIGLTTAVNLLDDCPSRKDEEIFRVALRQNVKLGAQCLNRRNHLRVERHQTLARADFLKLVVELNHSILETENFRSLVSEFVKTLGDLEAQKSLDKIFDQTSQTEGENPVRHSEKHLWKAIEHKQLSAEQKPGRLRTATAARKT
ncbi:MAG: hypothetical protein ACR2GD_01910 [Pyrinomonadaceae bacterium]